ncbi:MAG: patatin-like phospholipase family protein [Flavipsychrobacter sp.]|nr:patatin-like phospholipase family protein [Flavipsychrobacter sp.]
MPYPIEILTISLDLIKSVSAACESLNKVQTEFHFSLAEHDLREKLYPYKREKYVSNDVFKWLIEYKAEAKGHRPFIILIVNGYLSSNRWEDIFGTRSENGEFAVFTTYNFNQFVNDRVRYCRYYLVRYALSFLQPELKSHNEKENKDCIFHFKEKKYELLLSLASGHICDSCRAKLQPRLTIGINEAINKLLLVVSNQHSYAIILKGGGVKGLAFAGALLELEQHFSFTAYAGAIAAVLLGAGYTPAELLIELSSKNFNDFKDAGVLQMLANLFSKGGLYPGNEIESWISQLIKKKIKKENEVVLADIPVEITLYASRVKDGTIKFESHGDRKTAHAAYAARCSMSIPIYFTCKKEDGIKVYDGGLRNNFPLKRFIEDNPEKPFIGLYLKSTTKRSWSVLNELFNLSVDGEEMDFVDRNLDKIVKIDTTPIKTTDFKLTSDKKKFLILSGRVSALEFIKTYYPDIAIDDNKLMQFKNDMQSIKSKL